MDASILRYTAVAYQVRIRAVPLYCFLTLYTYKSDACSCVISSLIDYSRPAVGPTTLAVSWLANNYESLSYAYSRSTYLQLACGQNHMVTGRKL